MNFPNHLVVTAPCHPKGNACFTDDSTRAKCEECGQEWETKVRTLLDDKHQYDTITWTALEVPEPTNEAPV